MKKISFALVILFSLACLSLCNKTASNDFTDTDSEVFVDTIPDASKENIGIEENTSPVSRPILSLSERNEKLIGLCKSVDGTIDADVRGDILTVQFASVEPAEAQKIAEGILGTIKRVAENEHIKTVMVCDINYKLLGYAGDKK
jgi:hypothetical protein